MSLDALFVLLPQHTTGEVHHTLVYMGPPGEGVPSMEQCGVLAFMLARMYPRVEAVVTRHAMFGMNAETPVAAIEGVDLRGIRAPIGWLARSQWGYDPHISAQADWPLPPIGSKIVFDRIAVWYGEQRLTYLLGSGLRMSS